MANIVLDDRFKNYLLNSYPLEESLLNSILDDLGEHFGLTAEEFVSFRHRELHRQGLKNEEIYRIIQEELGNRLFPGPALSVRQIRRVIYG